MSGPIPVYHLPPLTQSSLAIINISLSFCIIQTLRELRLRDTQIGDNGAQILADVLSNNNVRYILSLSISFLHLTQAL
jgi:hypothetical protein